MSFALKANGKTKAHIPREAPSAFAIRETAVYPRPGPVPFGLTSRLFFMSSENKIQFLSAEEEGVAGELPVSTE